MMRKVITVGIVAWLITHWFHTAFLYSPVYSHDIRVSLNFSIVMTALAIVALVAIIFINDD